MENGYTQAHEFFEYLQEAVKKDPDGYAYWGKVISKDREKKVDIKHFQSIVDSNKENGFSTHLYISDYKNLWVAKVDEIVEGIGKDFKTLDFYKDKKIEVWFKISDITILEYCPETTASKLSELYIDNDYNDLIIEGLSPFTTGIKYPAIIQDLAEEHYFDELEDSDGKLVSITPEAIKNTGSAKVIKTLNTYCFPDVVYSKIPHSAKMEIESAELDMMDSRHHNFTKVAFSYIKAFEIIVNHLVIHHMKKAGIGDEFFVKPDVMPPKLYLNDFDADGLVPLGKFQKNFSINQLIYFVERIIKSNRLSFNRAFKDQKPFVKWFTNDLQKSLETNQLMKIRGILAHSDSDAITESDLLAVRNLILGIGQTGLIMEAFKYFYPEIRNTLSVQGNYEEKKSSGDQKSKSKSKKNHLKVA